MTVRYIDTHCHLQFKQYEQDREEIIERMKEEGVAAIVVGTDLETSKEAVVLAEKYEHLYAAVGIHPTHVRDIVSPSSDDGLTMSKLREFAKHPKVVAIGECGLDYFRPEEVNDEVKNKQKELLQKHITLATELDKPLVIHVRPSKGTTDAYADLIEILKEAKKEYPKLRGDIHFFAGGLAEAEAFFILDFTISFTAVITFSRDYDELIRAVPLANILSETDAPYVAPLERRGERNDSFAVKSVVAKIAEIKGEDVEVVRTTLLDNAKRLFAPVGDSTESLAGVLIPC
ncbi:MAG: TatD family hydrolase [Candidatus Paceibacterota bacterium]|jgi:TatD DNase family protein